MKAEASATSAETEANGVEQGTGRERAERPLRPAQCRSYMRRELAREFRLIVDGFVKEAKTGSCQHVKLANELLAPPPRPKRKPSGRATLRRLMEKMEKIQD